jgi:hypothetical protein
VRVLVSRAPRPAYRTFSTPEPLGPESPAVREDVRKVQNYVRALDEGLRLLPTLPISKRLVAQIHGVLMEGVGGRDKTTALSSSYGQPQYGCMTVSRGEADSRRPAP